MTTVLYISVCDIQVLAMNGDVGQDILSYVLDGFQVKDLTFFIILIDSLTIVTVPGYFGGMVIQYSN
jgi:hypothetical protein